MLDLVRMLLGALLRIFCTQQSLLLENLALRQQLAVPLAGAFTFPGAPALYFQDLYYLGTLQIEGARFLRVEVEFLWMTVH